MGWAVTNIDLLEYSFAVYHEGHLLYWLFLTIFIVSILFVIYVPVHLYADSYVQ